MHYALLHFMQRTHEG